MPTTRPGFIWSGTEWVAIGQEAVLAPVSYQATAPTSPATGDIWIDSDDEVPGITSSLNYRWRKIATGGETSLSGNDTSGLPLVYNPGYEQVYLNGVLLYRGSDYVATTGNTITGLTALVANDTIEVLSFVTAPIGDTYTQAAADAKFATTVNFPAGAWQTYTPTWTNLTVGNANNTGRYIQIGKTVHVFVSLEFGSTTSISGIFYPSLPVTPFAGFAFMGTGWGFDNSAVQWNNLTFTTGNYFISSSGSRYSATHPWTWATGDLVRLTMTYEAA